MVTIKDLKGLKLEEGAVYKIKRGFAAEKYAIMDGEFTCIKNYDTHILFESNKNKYKETVLKADLIHKLDISITKVEEES